MEYAIVYADSGSTYYSDLTTFATGFDGVCQAANLVNFVISLPEKAYNFIQVIGATLKKHSIQIKFSPDSDATLRDFLTTGAVCGGLGAVVGGVAGGYAGGDPMTALIGVIIGVVAGIVAGAVLTVWGLRVRRIGTNMELAFSRN